MNSIRERILREVVARLTSGVAPVPIRRYSTVPTLRQASTTLLIVPESDNVTAHINDRVDRLLNVRLVVVAEGNDAFGQADMLAVAAHAALMRDSSLGGLALALRDVATTLDEQDADNGTLQLSVRYEIRYRTCATDLTQMG